MQQWIASTAALETAEDRLEAVIRKLYDPSINPRCGRLEQVERRDGGKMLIRLKRVRIVDMGAEHTAVASR